MTDLVARVLLKADASGLVGQSREGATAIGGVGAAAVKAGSDAQGLTAGTAAAGASIKAAATSARDYQRDLAQLRAAIDPTGEAQRKMAQAVDLANTAFQRGDISAEQYAAALKRAEAQGRVNLQTMDRQAFGARNLGQQFGDLGLSIAGGISPARAFGQQAGQIGYALSEMGGKAGAVGAFLTGPWGIALTIAAAVTAPLVEELLSGGEAADGLKGKTLSLADALEASRFATDAARKALADYNAEKEKARRNDSLATEEALRSAKARLADAIAIREQIKATIQKALIDESSARMVGGGQLLQNVMLGEGALATQTAQIDQLRATTRNLQIDTAVSAAKAAVNPIEAINQRYDRMADAAKRAAAGNDRLAASIGATLTKIEQRRAADLKETQDEQRASNRKPPRTSLGSQLDSELGGRLLSSAQSYTGLREDRAGDNRQLRALFSEAKVNVDPKMVAWCAAFVNAVLATNGLPGTGSLSARSFLGYGEATDKPNKGDIVVLKRGESSTAGHVGFYAGERNGRVQVTSGNQGNGVSTAGFARSDVLGFRRAPSAADAYKEEGARARQLAADVKAAAAELDAITQQLTQAFNPGKAAGEEYLATLDKIAKAVAGGKFTPEVGDDFAKQALARYQETIPVGPTVDEMVADASESFRERAEESGARLKAEAAEAGREFRDAVGEVGDLFGAQVGGALRTLLGSKERESYYQDVLGPKIFDAIKSFGIDGEKAKVLGASIGTKASQAFAGAQDGAAIAGLANSLGLKLNGTGSQIGGALGNLTGLPGGAIIGSILGGITGNLFSKPKTGSATIGSVDGQAAVTGTSGNSGSYRQAASAAGGAVADSINAIVDQLGGQLGTFAVSIGKKDKKFIVDESGSGSTKTKRADVTGYKTLEEAQAAALRNAIADGAVAGLSPAVARALRSNEDVGKAVAEALQVRDLETLIGGTAGQLKRAFAEFDGNAAERVRLARKYGLDLVEVERINAEQRADLLDDTLKSRVGSLKDLLKNLQYGDLFEGDAATRRTSILGEINDAKADAEAGVDGAADRLAELYRSLVATSKEAFGTGGSEYGADRDAAIAGVERVVQIENDRIAAAAAQQKATTDAVTAGNALLNEGNDLMVAQNAILARVADVLGGGGRASPLLDFNAVMR